MFQRSPSTPGTSQDRYVYILSAVLLVAIYNQVTGVIYTTEGFNMP